MARLCQKINVHYFCLETALFGKTFGHMCKEKFCVPPPPPHPPGVDYTEKFACRSYEFFSTPPPMFTYLGIGLLTNVQGS